MTRIAGATGVVMYNHIPLESSRVITPDTTHGAAMLSYSDGAKVLAAFAAGNGAMMTFYNDTAVSSHPHTIVPMCGASGERPCSLSMPCMCCSNTVRLLHTPHNACCSQI